MNLREDLYKKYKMPQLRQTAFKIWIGDLLKAEYVENKGEWEPNFFVIGGKNVSRVNLVASVVSVYENIDKTMKSVDVDDSSGSVSLKAWGDDIKLLNFEIGDICLIIGRPRNSGGQIFVTPEIVKKLDINWAKLRKLELEKLYGSRERVESIVVSDVEKPVDSSRQKVLNILEKSGEITFDDLVSKSGVNEEDLKGIISELLKEGEIFEPKPNYLKVV